MLPQDPAVHSSLGPKARALGLLHLEIEFRNMHIGFTSVRVTTVFSLSSLVDHFCARSFEGESGFDEHEAFFA